MGLWGAHLRPPHYGAGLINSFSQWSSVAPISCLLFLTVLLCTNENENEKENNRFNAEIVVANYCFGTWNIGTLKGRSGEVCEVCAEGKLRFAVESLLLTWSLVSRLSRWSHTMHHRQEEVRLRRKDSGDK